MERKYMIIDSNVLFGFDIVDGRDAAIGDILELMDLKKIDRAILTNMKCKFFDFVEGNNETADIVKEFPDRFYGMVSFNPSQFIDVEAEVRRGICDLGLSGIRVFNTSSNFTSGWGGGLDSLTMRRIFGIVEEWSVPVFIEGGYPFDLVCRLAEAYTDIPFIASGVGYGNMGEAILAAQGLKNLYLEISTLDTMDGIAVLVEYLGCDKIIFGTGLPFNTPSSEILMVNMADIPPAAKERIFSGNILRLLNGRKVK